jgi:hypothetical protein
MAVFWMPVVLLSSAKTGGRVVSAGCVVFERKITNARVFKPVVLVNSAR